jgi:glycosyltransferase involved in cell wall biosynthesis
MPEVSVLLPFRDAAATLEEALDSVLAQRGVAAEVIAVDDGSRDGGGAIAARLAARHRGLRLLASGGVGIAGALELARAAARAPLLSRMDADDVSRPERLARQRDALLARPELAVLGARVEPFPDEAVGEGLRRYVAWQNGLLLPADHAREIFIESPLCHPSVMLRREPLEAVGGWREGPFPEDYDLWLRLDARGYALGKLPETLLGWRHHAGRVTFRDPRCAPERLRALKAPFLAGRLRALGRPVVVWGAGPTGRRLARELAMAGVAPAGFVDIDEKKIGRRARGVVIGSPEGLSRGVTVVAAVSALGARALIRAALAARGFEEGVDFLCAA